MEQKVYATKPVTLFTANGEVTHTERTSTPVRPLDVELDNVIVGECPPVASLGRFCIDDQMDFVWLGSQGKAPVLVQGGGTKVSYSPHSWQHDLRVDNYVPY